jgi:hypothetical protein
MSKRALFYVALPCVLAFSALSSNARAETVAAETAAHLLAKAYAVDSKCHYLDGASHEELSSLVAKAEVALASQSNVANTKSTMAAGRSAGRSAACSAERQVEVNEVLSAARSASQMAESNPNYSVAPNANPALQSTPKIRTAINEPKPRMNGGLQSYAEMTERYYRARRCFSMPMRQMKSFYADIVATHREMVKTYGVSAVAAVMHRSESNADHQGCG